MPSGENYEKLKNKKKARPFSFTKMEKKSKKIPIL
jgi:hypothetical protein